MANFEWSGTTVIKVHIERTFQFRAEAKKLANSKTKGQHVCHVVAWFVLRKYIGKKLKGISTANVAAFFSDNKNWFDKTQVEKNKREHNLLEIDPNNRSQLNDALEQWLANANSWIENLRLGEGAKNSSDGSMFNNTYRKIKENSFGRTLDQLFFGGEYHRQIREITCQDGYGADQNIILESLSYFSSFSSPDGSLKIDKQISQTFKGRVDLRSDIFEPYCNERRVYLKISTPYAGHRVNIVLHNDVEYSGGAFLLIANNRLNRISRQFKLSDLDAKINRTSHLSDSEFPKFYESLLSEASLEVDILKEKFISLAVDQPHGMTIQTLNLEQKTALLVGVWNALPEAKLSDLYNDVAATLVNRA